MARTKISSRCGGAVVKPNGMRAWRKTARRWRRKQNRHWRETGAPCIADGTGRWYRRQQAFFKQRPAAPSSPFTPRSLVGMTMGARKRMAWAEYLSACKESDPGLLVAASLQTWNEHELEAGFQRWRERQNQIRARYCIGERLRPCPGCFDCGVECWACHNPHEPDDECCGETGVIRAGRLRPEKRIPACTRPF